MSFHRNIFVNYASQLYVVAAGIALVPLYIRFMGAEAYGLVGFFAMLQAWFNLLDIGLTPTMARESARYNGGATRAIEFRHLARALEWIFVGIAVGGGALLYFLAETLAGEWLRFERLDHAEVVSSLRIVAVIVALRWMCGLYRGVITGAERLVWLGGFNIVVASLRFIGVLPLLILVSAAPVSFFFYQLCVAILELVGLAAMAYKLLPGPERGEGLKPDWRPFKAVLKFSLYIALTSSLWTLVTQTDKLVLSRILSLTDYGYFTAAVLLASGILLIGGPVSSALMPRLARLHAEGQEDQLIKVYRHSTRIVASIAIPATMLLGFFSSQILWAWSGDSELVKRAAPALRMYSVGYGFLAVGAFPYYLQYAKGNMRLHLWGSVLFALFLLPSIILGATHFGIEGAGFAWAAINAIYFFLWTPVVHRRFAPSLHRTWIMEDVAKPLLVVGVLASLIYSSVTLSPERMLLIFQLTLIAAVLACAAILLTFRRKGSSLWEA